MHTIHALPPETDLPALQRVCASRYPLLLQSVAHGTAQANTDMLLATSGQHIVLGADGLTRNEAGDALDGDFLDILDAQWRMQARPCQPSNWPFRGGWALLLGYELAGQIEPVLRLPPAVGGLPVAIAVRCPAAVLRDHASGECVLLAEEGSDALLRSVLADIDQSRGAEAVSAMLAPASLAEDADEGFVDGVVRILDYLAAGDIFQVNLSRGWQAEFEQPVDPSALYARLSQVNPAPFAGLFRGPGWAVVSASPERLVSVRGDVVETRPIAGTRPRFPGDDDAGRIRELIGHPKERAEHVMLVDLERNDLGRVCTPGSVEVDELMTVESYAHVHHIVSNVCGRLRAGVTPGEVIAAVFPGGTITGCPKVRCMQIIAELEQAGRGVYTGAMGWLNRDGDMDLNILIRSAEVEGAGLRFRTGAGIVADSIPLRELDETRAKARGLLQALSS